MNTPRLLERYEARIAGGDLERDPAQLAVLERLQQLADTLAARDKRGVPGLGWLIRRPPPVKGLYLWGAVGRGKTMLMDLFYEAVTVQAKRRVHFHAFMADVHTRIHAHRTAAKNGNGRDGDPIPPLAIELARDARLICFDEFAVTDIADAMILGRLFTALFERGIVVVATSNVAPDDLYAHGLNRALFLPFIELLKERTEAIKVMARTDFRFEKLAGSSVYYVPPNRLAKEALDRIFGVLAEGVAPRQVTLSLKGHSLEIPQAAGGVARIGYAYLCQSAFGAVDYLALAERFHTLILENIPVINAENRNEAKRFITLIDTLYDHQVKLIASAEAAPTELYRAEDGREAFEFERTVSRLIEMQSDEYRLLPHGRGGVGSGQP
jgi:cell division protein ZapE